MFIIPRELHFNVIRRHPDWGPFFYYYTSKSNGVDLYEVVCVCRSWQRGEVIYILEKTQILFKEGQNFSKIVDQWRFALYKSFLVHYFARGALIYVIFYFNMSISNNSSCFFSVFCYKRNL